jgi:hypothetical protein
MTLIDGDRIITAQLYDDEHEEFTEEKMSIIDYINAYTDEGVTTADDVLDKIRAEIDEQYDRVHPYNISCAEGLEMALGIIDKYTAEGSDKK